MRQRSVVRKCIDLASGRTRPALQSKMPDHQIDDHRNHDVADVDVCVDQRAPAAPIAIDDSETIVRAIVAPAHHNKGKIATAVFRPRRGETSLSVMRQLMGDDFCKAKGVEIGEASPSQHYVGLLTIKAAAMDHPSVISVPPSLLL